MHRFFLPPADFVQDRPTLSSAESHHATQVLRLGAGDKIAVFDGDGHEGTAVIEEADARAVVLSLRARQTTPPLACEITLVQAIPKGKNMELILQKAVELGAARIAPLLSDRTIVRLDAEERQARQAKWHSVVLEACKQCGQNRLPEILPPSTVKDFLQSFPLVECPLIASLQPDARSVAETLQRVRTDLGRPPTQAAIMIGPEGDFTPAETAMAKSAGFFPVTLGPIILRTETAALYSLSVLAHELFQPAA
jgi:16S rRNA (uracil1498-N3)-methyltransferase